MVRFILAKEIDPDEAAELENLRSKVKELERKQKITRADVSRLLKQVRRKSTVLGLRGAQVGVLALTLLTRPDLAFARIQRMIDSLDESEELSLGSLEIGDDELDSDANE